MPDLRVNRISKTDLISLISIEVVTDITEIIPVMKEVMKNAEEITDRCMMISVEGDTILLEPNPRVIII